jgi:cytochrome b561
MLKNSTERFGSVAQLLHWGVALLMLGSYVLVYCAQLLYERSSPPWRLLVQAHTSVGMTIALLVLIRIYWRLANQVPLAEPGTKIELAAARLGHFLLYFFMVTMPITGWMGTDKHREYFWTFSYPPFQATSAYDLVVTRWLGLSWEQFNAGVDFYHKLIGEWLLSIVVAVHIAAAFYHHYVKRDRTLVRMLPTASARVSSTHAVSQAADVRPN